MSYTIYGSALFRNASITETAAPADWTRNICVVCSRTPNISTTIAPTNRQPMPVVPARRKTHSKSRQGCLQCKRRHTKASAIPAARTTDCQPSQWDPGRWCYDLFITTIARSRRRLFQTTDWGDSAMRSIRHAQIVFDCRSRANGHLHGPRYSTLHHKRRAWDRVLRHARILISGALSQHRR